MAELKPQTDIDVAFKESTTGSTSTKTPKARKTKDIDLQIPRNTSYMNSSGWVYEPSIRNAYVWRKNNATIWLGYEEHNCRILITITKNGKEPATHRIDVTDIGEGLGTVKDIFNRY